jgi:Xaa-Pro aminopeptidase
MADQSTTSNRSTTPTSERFRDFVRKGWAAREGGDAFPHVAASYAKTRRHRVSALRPRERIVVPAGPAVVRSNDMEYRFRAHSAFAYLTGWGSDAVPGSVLVLEPSADGHRPLLYFRATAGRDTDEFYANPEVGEFWTGPRPSLRDVAAQLGIETRPIAELGDALRSGSGTLRVVRDADAEVTALVDRLRTPNDGSVEDRLLARDLSELRLVKDSYEIAELRRAVDATRQGFDDVVADLPAIVAHARGERLVEGTFTRRARAEGNAVGYDVIAASGAHACILHWMRNDGPVVPGDLLLVDAGVEVDSLYTADITRTLPVSGTFTPIQRLVYAAVLQAADAARAVVRPGITLRDVHDAAMEVIAARTADWGLLPVTAEESLAEDAQFHRRYMVHGTGHHLGLDVHDCALARREVYLNGVLQEGMVFTIEPGLYFQPDDLTVPQEFRGIGVRIEDNVLVTASGSKNLSAAIPRTADEVEAWIARLSIADVRHSGVRIES